MTETVARFSEISSLYRAAFVDLWGCLHNGVRALPPAVAALQQFRSKGGIVILVTNSPRPRAGVERQLERFGVPRDCWDAIATSGDSARAAMFIGAVGERVWHIGEKHDGGFFEPLKIIRDAKDITRVPLAEAEGIVCTGPFDPLADPSVNRADFLFAKNKGLKLLCANPDIVVDRGHVREWCAGALAELYSEMGGESLYFGKPHPPIYDLSRLRLDAIEPGIGSDEIIAIGDGIHTDVKGALGEGLHSLFITGGLAAEETGTADGKDPDAKALRTFLARQKIAPSYAISQLR
ncbi:MAG: TIGR01459 family HAD-type hydrolase [Pseudomonadota bacterium]